MPLVIEVTDRKCKRTGRLTSHDYHIFFRKWNQSELLLTKTQ